MSLTVAVFSFDPVNHSGDGDVLVYHCVVTADMPFFNGHFPGMPIMPAVAQIEMIRALLEKHADWNTTIAGGSSLKFSGRIQPNDRLTIRLQRRPFGDISFSVENKDAVVSKGILKMAGGTLD
jgi:3-hydroxymyristoyl/3-hydroxydecanoyl-(acyl carrier protein) dehydratase